MFWLQAPLLSIKKLPKSIDKISNLSYNIHMLKKKLLSRSRELTLPDERYRSVKWAQGFLSRLAGGDIPRVPKAVRDEARSILRHYPSDWDMNRAAAGAPEVFQERMEDLHRFVAAGSRAAAAEEDQKP
jgi:hypothetical protein